MTSPSGPLRLGACVVCAALVAACDRAASTAPVVETFTRYVAVGTGVSMGVQSDGVNYETQLAAWPARLARQALGAPLTQPLLEAPGCPAPLLAPLLLARRATSDTSAVRADTACAAVFADVPHPAPTQPTLPQRPGDLAIDRATASDALHTTPAAIARRAASTARDTVLRKLYARVLAERETQAAAMAAQRPTLVSVELGLGEVLRAVESGVAGRAGTFEEWRAPYDSLVDSVASTGARGLLAGVPRLRGIAGLRRGAELAGQAAVLDTLGVALVGCDAAATNLVFVPRALVPALARARTSGARQTVSCAGAADSVDFVLTDAEAQTLDALIARMNAHIDSLAARHGFAVASLTPWEDAVAAAQTAFAVRDLLTCPVPYGPYTSLDGVHPSADGQQLIANAAAAALGQRYGLTIPTLVPPTRAACTGAAP